VKISPGEKARAGVPALSLFRHAIGLFGFSGPARISPIPARRQIRQSRVSTQLSEIPTGIDGVAMSVDAILCINDQQHRCIALHDVDDVGLVVSSGVHLKIFYILGYTKILW